MARDNFFLTIFSLVLVLLFISTLPIAALTWQPYDFSGNECYSYSVFWKDVKFQFDFEITAIDDLFDNEKELFDVSLTYKLLLDKNMLGEGIFETFELYSLFTVTLFNPIYFYCLENLDYIIGEALTFAGTDLMVAIIAREKIGGREGFLCRFTENEEIIGEWVIDPELALPLRSTIYSRDEIEAELLLLNYTEY